MWIANNNWPLSSYDIASRSYLKKPTCKIAANIYSVQELRPLNKNKFRAIGSLTVQKD